MTVKRYFFNTMLPAVFYGAITGIITGLVIWGYTYLAEQILSLSEQMYEFVHEKLAFIPVLIGVLIIGALANYYNGKLVPSARGGGVPYIEGAVRGLLPLKWYATLPATFVGSFTSFLCGLPLGSEGPSVLIGGSVGGGVNDLSGKYENRKAWRRLSITAGASAGFAVALSAPLSGILFSLEECHKKISPVIMIISSIAVLFATVTSGLMKLATGMTEHALFVFTYQSLPITLMYLPLIAGLVAGLAASLFSVLMTIVSKIGDKLKGGAIKTVAVFLLCGIAAFFLVDEVGGAAIGGGTSLINLVGNLQLSGKILLVLLIVKAVLLLLCSSAKVSGGMFIPFMCLGALMGGLLAKIMVVCGMSETLASTIIIITMCAFLGAMLKAPITAVVLVVELAGVISGEGTSMLLAAVVAVGTAFVVTELLHIKPVYEANLEKLVAERAGEKSAVFKAEFAVKDGSYAVGKALRDILLPPGVIIEYKSMDGNYSYNYGDRVIKAGDLLVATAKDINEKAAISALKDLFGDWDT